MELNCGVHTACPASVRLTKKIDDVEFEKTLVRVKKSMNEKASSDAENMALSAEGRLSITPYEEKHIQEISKKMQQEADERKKNRKFDELDWLDNNIKKRNYEEYYKYMHGYPRAWSSFSMVGTRPDEYPKTYLERTGNVVKVRHITMPPNKTKSRRGTVSSFSKKSRTRLREFLQSIDWNSIEVNRIYEITLTYHNNFSKDGKKIKNDLKKLIKNILYNYPKSVIIWKLEYQRRGAPHYHLIMIAESPVELGDYLVMKNGEFKFYNRETKTYLNNAGENGLRNFIQLHWNRITKEDAENFNSGIEVDRVRNSSGLPHYLVKYVSKDRKFKEEDYQHDVPDWMKNAGQWWGCYNKDLLNIGYDKILINHATYKEIEEAFERYWRDHGMKSYKKHDWGSNAYFMNRSTVQKYVYDLLLDFNELE